MIQVTPQTLMERLQQAALRDPLFAEAAARIQQLELLCGMMTDTGVILEEDVQDLISPDTWWLAGSEEGVAYTDLRQAMEELSAPGQVLEWCRAHTLENGWAVLYEELRDGRGRVLAEAGVHEFDNLEQAEECAAEYALLRRRAEYNAL